VDGDSGVQRPPARALAELVHELPHGELEAREIPAALCSFPRRLTTAGRSRHEASHAIEEASELNKWPERLRHDPPVLTELGKEPVLVLDVRHGGRGVVPAKYDSLSVVSLDQPAAVLEGQVLERRYAFGRDSEFGENRRHRLVHPTILRRVA
jgi:hypothetical protein